ncbi:MAG: hypothetical protein JO359_08240 [Candidatus Eremiobacteraeota bacterium]|nr:hypothetical protein [Candidatus Eremiobacteraeota bacterium]
MGCTAIAPGMTPLEQARFLEEHLPPGLFRIAEGGDAKVAWRIAPEPFGLSPATVEKIASLGDDLLAFYRGLNALYTRSARGTAPEFIAEYLDRGKPDFVIRLARQNRFRSDLVGVIRPDLILTDDGFIASELDSLPGGMGFVGAMAEQYCRIGYESIGTAEGIADGFAAMAASTAQRPHPVVAIVVSEESADYRNELDWLARKITERGTATVYCAAPQEIVFTEQALFVRLPDGREEKLDVIYRNFELFDLLNVPKWELMLYAARKNRVKMTPPPKPQLEEKLSFALFHHPALEDLWRAELGPQTFERLQGVFPQTWVLDPRRLPPQAAIHSLSAGGKPVFDWMQLAGLGKSERDFVIKPSGFSPLAWGARGVKVANDLPRPEWTAALSEALSAYERTPSILQRFRKGRRVAARWWERESGEIRIMEGRIRLSPYYFVVGERTQLGGILATIAPADKRLIHGMRDAVMAPCILSEDGA